jgi:hypothetical protein
MMMTTMTATKYNKYKIYRPGLGRRWTPWRLSGHNQKLELKAFGVIFFSIILFSFGSFVILFIIYLFKI